MMLLTANNVISYLFHKGNISEAQMLNCSIEAIDKPTSTSRNNVQTVNDYFLKQAKIFDSSNMESILVEANVYEYFMEHPEMSKYMPEFIQYDDENCILATRYVELAPIRTAYQLIVHKSSEIPPPTVEELGIDVTEKIATIFNHFKTSSSCHRDTVYKSKFWALQDVYKPQWFMLDPKNIKMFVNSSNQLLQSIGKFIETDEVKQTLNELKSTWEYSHLIHRDIKFENIQVVKNNSEEIEILFMDWEMAIIGDYDWDAAGFVYALFYSELEPFKTYKNSFTKAFLKTYLSTNYNDKTTKKVMQYAALYALNEIEVLSRDSNPNNEIRAKKLIIIAQTLLLNFKDIIQ
jgi:serine/threonine protein kinase